MAESIIRATDSSTAIGTGTSITMSHQGVVFVFESGVRFGGTISGRRLQEDAGSGDGCFRDSGNDKKEKRKEGPKGHFRVHANTIRYNSIYALGISP